MVGGKPAFRSHKESFMHLLGMSLSLNKNESMETRIMEQNNLSLFKKELSVARGETITSNLLGKYYSDLDYFLFDDFTFMPQTIMAYFVDQLMKNTGYASQDMHYLMRLSGQMDNELALSFEEQSEDKTKLWEHLEWLEVQWTVNKIHSSTDKEFHSTLIDMTSKDNKRKRKKFKKVALAAAAATMAAVKGANATDDDDDDEMDALIPEKDNKKLKKEKKIKKIKSTTDLPTTTTSKKQLAKLRPNQPFIGIFVTFGKRMANFFNVNKNQNPLIASFGFPSINPSDYHVKLTPNFCKPKIEKLMVYSDLVHPTVKVGDFETNLLDVISVENSDIFHRPFVPSSQKKLRKHIIDSVSILCTDDRGEPIHFEKNAKSTFEIHIKPDEAT